eukprot:TRINITY_DN2343_c3_g2_i1.p1 TRINITY_DN2343_c3_g2~~TRINITY_DN2343_c3_g2_i1.p1  ORF type:complete len:198 (+),score=8.08 TRINITY_DN2343_c3_g2_i1:57-650(+)
MVSTLTPCELLNAVRTTTKNGLCFPLECVKGYQPFTEDIYGNVKHSCALVTEDYDKGINSTVIGGLIIGFVLILCIIAVLVVRFGCKKKTSLEVRRDKAKEIQSTLCEEDTEDQKRDLTRGQETSFYPPLEANPIHPSSPTKYPYGAPHSRPPSPHTPRSNVSSPHWRPNAFDEIETQGNEPIGDMSPVSDFEDCEV